MADRNDSYNLEIKVNADGIEATVEALNDVDKSAEKAEDSIKSLGAQTSDCGVQSQKLGVTWGKIGSEIGSKIKTPFINAFKTISDKTKAFGTQFKTTANNVVSFLKHPIETIKGKLYGALTGVNKKTIDVSDSTADMGNKMEDAGSKGENGMSKITGALKKLLAAALAVKATQAVSSFVKDCIGASETMIENTKSLNAILGKNAEAANEWAEQYSKAANRSAGEVKGFMVDSAAMFKTMGLNNDAATQLAESTTALGYDLAAAFNVKDDREMMSALTSAISGSTDAMAKYGVQLDDATLKRTAASMGIKGEISDLDDAVAAQVRYQAILEQTTDAQLGAFNAAGNYRNGIKSIKGVYENFLSTAGEKFQPILGGLFDKILGMWPKVEPALMGLVDLLSDGLSESVPIIAELAEELVPVLADTLGAVFSAVKPIFPMILDIAKKALPPLANLIGSLASNLLPPLISCIQIILPPIADIASQILPLVSDILVDLSPIFAEIGSDLLPPIMEFAQGVIPFILQIVEQCLPPLLDLTKSTIPFLVQVAEAILPPLISCIEILLPPLLDIVSSILPVFQSILSATMPIFVKLAEALMPALQSTLSAISPILSAIVPVLEVIGNVLGVIVEAVSWIIDKVLSVGSWVLSLFGVDMNSASSVTDTKIPSNAGGTDNFEGGWTHINELGGEMAYLPKGSQIIPADKSQQVADALETTAENGKTSSESIYNITVPITIQGNVDTTVMATIDAQIKAAVKQAIEEAQQKELNDRLLQFA